MNVSHSWLDWVSDPASLASIRSGFYLVGIIIGKQFFEDRHFFTCQRDALAHLGMVGRPVADVQFCASAIPADQVDLTLPA